VSQNVSPPPPRRASLYRDPPTRDYGRFIRIFAWAVLGALVCTFGYVFFTLRGLPDPNNQPVLGHSIVVYARDGREIEQRNAQGAYYQVLDLKQMGNLGPAATLAAEDRDFYHHGAIDYRRTASAALQDLAHQSPDQGGSTITRQLIKIEVLTPQKSIFRKMQEAILATALERENSKDKILEMYLNRVFYGHNAYGLGAAAKVYFDRQPRDLSAGQAAFLAALINGPSYYDPLTHYDRAHDRELYVLDGLVKTGVLTQAEADQAGREDLKSELKFDQSFRRSAAPHFVDYVLGQLEQDPNIGPQAVQQGGFAVYTTLDLGLQQSALTAVQAGVAKLKYTGVNNGDLLAANPKTGEILAYVGSADYYNNAIGGQFDVIRSPRQPGSSFKPYVFEAALRDHRITLSSTLHDQPTDFGGGYKPLDFDNSFMGDLTARRSLLLSRNVPAVEVGQAEGIDRVISLAGTMGINPSELKPYPSTAIGASPISMRENVQGYQVFANQGSMVPLFGISKVTDAQGTSVFSHDPQTGATQPLSPAEAYLITSTLRDYPQTWGLGWRVQMAGKSGTTGGAVTGVHGDAWMMAYNPNLVVGAWAGNTAADGGGKSISTFGTQVGQTVLAPFINSLPANMRTWYPPPQGLVYGAGCPDQNGTGGGRELYLPGTENGLDCPTPTPTPTPTDQGNGDNGSGANPSASPGTKSKKKNNNGGGITNGNGGVLILPPVAPSPQPS
jgi:membrane peptidoglycan carboxypeptidase